MDTDTDTGTTRPHGRTHEREPRDAVVLWTRIAACVVAFYGACNLIAWGNRWYIADVFAGTASDGDSWEYAYDRLATAHEALLVGIVLLLVAGTLAALARKTARARHR